MTGHNTFEQIVALADSFDNQRTKVPEPISLEDFELWQKDVVWDALHGIRYGQSFCNRFGISDNLLYYTTWPYEQIDEYIKKTYVDQQ
jgi:hypothetical protein